jgi:hypothetical protein
LIVLFDCFLFGLRNEGWCPSNNFLGKVSREILVDFFFVTDFEKVGKKFEDGTRKVLLGSPRKEKKLYMESKNKIFKMLMKEHVTSKKDKLCYLILDRVE